MQWNWPAQTLRDCRMAICEAYFFDGPQAALMAVATASNELAVLVAEWGLMPSAAWDTLQEVSENLTLVRGSDRTRCRKRSLQAPGSMPAQAADGGMSVIELTPREMPPRSRHDTPRRPHKFMLYSELSDQ